MMRSVLREWYLLGGVLFALASALAPLATAQGAPPDFSAGEAGWVITVARSMVPENCAA